MLVSTIAATIAGAIAIIVEIAFWSGALFGGGDEDNNLIGSLAMIILAPFAAMLIQMAVSRSREYLADKHGAHLIGDGKDLASALQKLESIKPQLSRYKPNPKQEATAHLMFMNMFNLQGLAGLFSTHPSTASRIERLNKY
jgi:heat shock protein HtpX